MPRKLVWCASIKSLVLLLCTLLGCKSIMSGRTDSNLGGDEGSPTRQFSDYLNPMTEPGKSENGETTPPYLFYEPGYSFPSFRTQVFGEVVTISLHPHMKRLAALGISRLALAPEGKKLAIIFSKKPDASESLLILDLTKNSIDALIDNVYDFVWGDSDTLLFYTLKPYGIPSELYALNQGVSKRLLIATSPGESILIQRGIHDTLRIQKTYTPLRTTVGLLTFENLRKGEIEIPWYDGTALAFNDQGTYVLSYGANRLGELLHYSPHTLNKKVIASGTPERALLGLVEIPQGVILYWGDGHTRSLSIIHSDEIIRSYSPPFPLLQLSGSYSKGLITISGESVLCPPEKLAELRIKGRRIEHSESFKKSICGNVSTSLQATQSRDGTRIPLTLTKLAEREKGLLLYLYGAYGVSLPLHYSERLRFLAEEGFVIALCHVRGGGEFGPHWHEQTRLSGKKLTVEDAESCLLQIEKSYPPSLPVAGFGYSAGGWLLTQLARIRPNYFSALLLDAPMITLPDRANKRSPSHEELEIREELEWNGGKVVTELRGISYPKDTHMFTIIREADNLVIPSSLQEWMNTIRSQVSSHYRINSYLAKNATHLLKLTPHDESSIRSSWKELLGKIVREKAQ